MLGDNCLRPSDATHAPCANVAGSTRAPGLRMAQSHPTAESKPHTRGTHAGDTVRALRPTKAPETKAGVVPFRGCRGHCVPLWAVFQPLQVVLSSACSVASLSRFPNRYLPGHPYLRGGAPADYLFGKGSPSTQRTGRTAAHGTPSATPEGTERCEPPRMSHIHTKTTQLHISLARGLWDLTFGIAGCAW